MIFVLGTLLLLFSAFYFALHAKKVQMFVIHTIARNIESDLGAKVQIGAVDFHPFNRLILKDIYIQDLSKDTLLSVQSLSVGVNIWKLLGKKIEIKSVSFDNMYVNLSVDTFGVSNVDFIIHYIDNSIKKDSTLIYKIDHIKLKHTRFKYIDYRTVEGIPKVFNPGNILFKDINGDISINRLSQDSLNVSIHSFSGIEKSGLQLNGFSTKIEAGKKTAKIKQLELKMPNSSVKLAQISANYNNISNWKNFIEKAKVSLSIEDSELNLKDITPFIPQFSAMAGKLDVSGKLTGTLANLKAKDIRLSYGDAFCFDGDFDLSGLPNVDETFLYADIKDIKFNRAGVQHFISDISGRPFVLPTELSNLGTIHYSGKISGFFSNLVAYGSFRTNLGKLSTDILIEVLPQWKGLKYSGSLNTSGFRLGRLLGESSQVGDVSLKISVTGHKYADSSMSGVIDANVNSFTFNSYSYDNILIKGNFDGSGFEGFLNIDDKNAKISFNGKIDLTKKLPIWNFSAKADDVNLTRLNLLKSYPDLFLSFNFSTNLVGSTLDNANGKISIEDISIRNKSKHIFVDRIGIYSDFNDTLRVLDIHSDVIKGKIKGNYSLVTIGNSLNRFLSKYLPAINSGKKENKTFGDNSFVFSFSKFNVNPLAEVLELPLFIDDNSIISGFYDDTYDKFRLEVDVPFLKLENTKLTDIHIISENPIDLIETSISTKIGDSPDKLTLNIQSEVKDNVVNVNLDWVDEQKTFQGNLKLSNNLTQQNNVLFNNMTILPSQIVLNDTVWNMRKSEIYTDMKSYRIKNFIFEHNNQHIKVDGIFSDRMQDSATVELNDVRLEHIFKIIKLHEPIITSRVTGKFLIQSGLKNIALTGDLFGKDFHFNHSYWGDVVMKTNWDDERKKLNAFGKAIKGNDTLLVLKGEYFPKPDSVEFYATANGLSIDFLRHYLDGVIQNIDGKAYGTLHLFGTLQQLLFDGDIPVKNGKFDVDFLKTSYSFSDTVRIKKDQINFRQITLFDKDNNKGILNGRVSHNEAFKDIRFNLNIDCKNVLVLNTRAQDNTYFYGKAYGTGNVGISGNTEDILFNINMRTEPNTQVFIPFDNLETATESYFINFINNQAKKEEVKLPLKKPIEEITSTNIRVNLLLDANPNAEVTLITDVVGGDYLKGTGYGNLRIDYDLAGDMKMYGNYEVEQGEYLFTLQQVFRKNFTIKKGGTMRWSGDPYSPIINIDAKYPISSVSLLDLLDESQLEGVKRSNVPVNCLLNLTGELMQPTIKLDVELPTDDELQRRVKNVVNTEEQMNLQIIYLLLMSRFYTPDYMRADTGTGVNEIAAVLGTTLSGQLNNWLSQLVDNLNVNFNYKQTNALDPRTGQYEVELGYQPNNRLVLNGKMGYREDNLAATNFIGDFDLEYKLNRSGKLRAKAYTHTNDKYYLKSSLTTQGVGIMYKEDFNSLKEVLNYYWNTARNKKLSKDSVKVKK